MGQVRRLAHQSSKRSATPGMAGFAETSSCKFRAAGLTLATLLGAALARRTARARGRAAQIALPLSARMHGGNSSAPPLSHGAPPRTRSAPDPSRHTKQGCSYGPVRLLAAAGYC